MNYILEIKAFYDVVMIKNLSTGQIALWHALMHINNKCGWKEWFSVANSTLQIMTGLSRKGVYNARVELSEKKLIKIDISDTQACRYSIKSLLVFANQNAENSPQSQKVFNNNKNPTTQSTTQDATQPTTQYTTQSTATLNKQYSTKQNINYISKNPFAEMVEKGDFDD